jgi:hypothetical protein
MKTRVALSPYRGPNEMPSTPWSWRAPRRPPANAAAPESRARCRRLTVPGSLFYWKRERDPCHHTGTERRAHSPCTEPRAVQAAPSARAEQRQPWLPLALAGCSGRRTQNPWRSFELARGSGFGACFIGRGRSVVPRARSGCFPWRAVGRRGRACTAMRLKCVLKKASQL